MKKTLMLLTAIFVCLFSLGLSAFAETPLISADSASGAAGKAVVINIDISGCGGFANLSLEVGYDADVFTLESSKRNTSVDATFVASRYTTVNPYFLSWNNIENTVFEGSLVTLNFKINENAASGVYPITVSYYKGEKGTYIDGININYDEDFEPLNLTYANGSITVIGDEQSTPTPAVKVTTGGGGGRTASRTDGTTDKIYSYIVSIPEDVTITADDIIVKIGNVTAKKQSSFAKKFEAITGGSVSFTSAVTNIPSGASLKDIKCVVSVSYVIDGINTTDGYEFNLE